MMPIDPKVTDNEQVEELAYLITAKRFQERGLRGVILEPDIAVARPLATFLVENGYEKREVVAGDAVDGALRALMLDPEVPTGVRPHLLGGEVLVIRERTDAEPIVRAVLAAREPVVVDDSTTDAVAAAIAKAADADYWVDEIREWEASEDWEREAHPQERPSAAYEDREWYRKQARAAVAALTPDGQEKDQ